MRAFPCLASVVGAALMSAASLTAHAEGPYYDPSNAASPSGSTVGYELYKTIGYPGRAEGQRRRL